MHLRDSRRPGLTEPRPNGSYWAMTYRERKLTLDHIHAFLTTQGHGERPRTRAQLNAGPTSETTRTWKMIHAILALIHSNKVNMKEWLWWPNDIRGPCGPKASWHMSYRWGEEDPEKTSARTLVATGDRTRARCVTGACYRLFHNGGLYANYMGEKISFSNFSPAQFSKWRNWTCRVGEFRWR